MTFVTNKGSWLLMYLLNITNREALTTFGNIFLGGIEAPLLIRPYLPFVTKSELTLILAGGFSSVAGGVLAVYISLNVLKRHVLTCCLMSPFATVALSKIIYPETEVVQTQTNKEDVFQRLYKLYKILKLI